MEFTFHGGASEVGRSCIEVDRRFLFDCGLKITEEGTEFPLMEEASHIKAVFLSHAHLDHCGALPLMHKNGLRCGIFCTNMTRETSKILLKDSFEIDLLNKHYTYSKEDLKAVISFMENVNYEKSYRTDDVKFKFVDAGHIPGAATIVADIDGMRVCYSGDFSMTSTNLVKAADYHLKDIDVLICESTYGSRNHPDRIKEEEDFLQRVKETLDNGGSVLVPAFAVGRAQEIIEILNKRQFNVPIFLDGMAKRVTNLYKRKAEFINNPNRFNKSVDGVQYIKKWKDREWAARQQAIIVTTSGMLDGGPVIEYMKYLYKDEKNSILLTGYQGEGTNGRMLLEEGRVFIDGIRVKVSAFVKKYDFSAHAGRSEIVKLIKKVQPRHLILQHGDEGGLQSLYEEFKDKMDVHVPKIGETLDLE